MCGPIAAAGIGLAGSVIQGIGAAKQASAAASQAKEAGEQQARAYERNARFQAVDFRRQAKVNARNFINQSAIHKRQAELERIKGSYDAARMTEKGRQIVGNQIAAFASSGIALEGTIADVVHKTGESIALDIAAARFGSSVAIENEGILARINKENAKLALKYGEQQAQDSIQYGKEAAEDARKYGANAAAAARSTIGLAFAAPVLAGVGNFATSGVFQ